MAGVARSVDRASRRAHPARAGRRRAAGRAAGHRRAAPRIDPGPRVPDGQRMNPFVGSLMGSC